MQFLSYLRQARLQPGTGEPCRPVQKVSPVPPPFVSSSLIAALCAVQPAQGAAGYRNINRIQTGIPQVPRAAVLFIPV
ncbi:MAG: hypothetical protein LUO98_02885 [Methanoregula sp.]|nr:hypothetical protein [Methanoregula sp.]